MGSLPALQLLLPPEKQMKSSQTTKQLFSPTSFSASFPRRLGFLDGSDGKASACNAGKPWVQSLGQEDPLEKEMATHSSNLAWKIPWMEEPGGLQSMGSQRVGQD